MEKILHQWRCFKIYFKSMNKETTKLETAVFGGGCFWCLEAYFSALRGVDSVISGYAGGHKANPTYEEVSSGTTGHAEVIKITLDPEIIKFSELLNIFFLLHDPTTRNRQGNDIGEQYRSIIFYADELQETTAKNIIAAFDKKKIYSKKIVTAVKPLKEFYRAEEYHQRYFERHPENAYCNLVISPKIAKLKKEFSKYVKE